MLIEVRLLDNISFDLMNPNIDHIDIEHISISLSNICRFNGQIKKFLSVAQHCCTCVKLAKNDGIKDEKILLSILLHDAAEAYTGDIITPIKQFLGPKYKRIEKSLDKAISKKFNVNFKKYHDIIKKYDSQAYEIEKYLKSSSKFMDCWSIKKSRKVFLKEFNKYAKHLCPN